MNDKHIFTHEEENIQENFRNSVSNMKYGETAVQRCPLDNKYIILIIYIDIQMDNLYITVFINSCEDTELCMATNGSKLGGKQEDVVNLSVSVLVMTENLYTTVSNHVAISKQELKLSNHQELNAKECKQEEPLYWM